MAKIEEIEIPYEGTNVKVKIKRLDWGESLDVQEQAMKINVIGNSSKVEFNHKILQLLSVKTAIVDAPFPHANIEDLRKLDNETGTALFKAVDELNSIGKKKEKS